MKILPLSAITIPPRQREKIIESPLRELITDIATNGLHHPLVVEAKDDGSHVLLAGERRYRALQSFETPYFHGAMQLDPGFAPCTIYENVDEEKRILIELNENLLREDITWQEECAALASLHEVRKRNNPTQTIDATAIELAEARGLAPTNESGRPTLQKRVQRAILIAPHLSEATVKNARSASEAHQAIIRNMEAEIANRLHASAPSSPHTFISGKFEEVQNQLIVGSYDVIIADPPYGMDADSFGSTTTKHAYADDKRTAYNTAEEIIRLGFFWTKPQAFLFLFCDIELFHELREIAAVIGWKPWRTPLIWNKTTPGIEPIPHQGFARQYELILYAVKGNKHRTVGASDVISIPRISSPGHSAAKPPDLYTHLLSRSGNAGDSVLDPCCGVGTVFHAARKLNWIATGIELDNSLAARCEAAMRGTGETIEVEQAL